MPGFGNPVRSNTPPPNGIAVRVLAGLREMRLKGGGRKAPISAGKSNFEGGK